MPAYSTESVAQHTFSLLLELCNHTGKCNEAVQAGKWSECPDFTMTVSPLFQLSGKTMGIVGYGTIGKRVGQIAEAMGMTVCPYSRDPEKAIKSDVISLHCPATPENLGFVNSDFISRMKDGAFLINTARGALINEADLAEAVKSGKLSGAAVDVVWGEPIDPANPLLGVENIIITSHMAWTLSLIHIFPLLWRSLSDHAPKIGSIIRAKILSRAIMAPESVSPIPKKYLSISGMILS